ncbi:MAG: type II toxin-antitoxin system HicB family antitoxin [Akkermansia sp.]|nr:type II toxin-antitoxin system HicB family antitoxin [Akkermansiaceae bacterium]MBQ3143972.1 type II toxin-antitoxin system HicB family antitoxin [Akkermansia sp.]
MHSKYSKTLEWSDADNAWIAGAPELPGCKADGETPEEALAELEIVIAEWLEEAQRIGNPIPAPLPSIESIALASPYLNTSAIARDLGIAPRTFCARISNRTPLRRQEAERLRENLNKHNLVLM